ncbi:DUF6612 family protein [Alkalicoccus luteus]|uniref:DUF6612 family protein n=1 Tax=Alkalicoccus luteus TaxID=1237094 RepID=UPI004033CE85
MKKAVICMSTAVLFAAPAAVSANGDAANILAHSNDAMDSLESYSSTIELEQTITENGEGFTTESIIEQDIIVDPFKLRQETTTIIPELGEEETLLSYWTDEGFFQEDGEGGWIRLDDGMDDAMMAQDSLGDTEAWADDFDVSEEDGYYVLTYTGDADDLDDLAEAFDDMNGDMEGMPEEMEAMMEVEDFSYELHIDSETYYVTEALIDLSLDMDIDGITASIEQLMTISFHNFNGVEDFDVPEEALAAEDLEEVLEDELGDELPATATSYPLWMGIGIALAAAGTFFITGRRGTTTS